MPVDPDTLDSLQDKYLVLHEFVRAAKNRPLTTCTARSAVCRWR